MLYVYLLVDVVYLFLLVLLYMGFRFRGLFLLFPVMWVYLLSLLLRCDVVFLGDCYYYYYYLMKQFLLLLDKFQAPEPGPGGGCCMYGGASITTGINSCSGWCV